MAKVTFTKLGLKPNNEVVNVEFNGQNIEVKQYLPVEEKLELVSKVLELSHDENNFANPIKVEIFMKLTIIEYYTNISFTEKQRENPAKIYDLLSSNGVIDKVIENLPEEEYEYILFGVEKTITSIYKYRNSLYGILDAISTDYDNLKLDASDIQNQLDPNSLKLVKDIMTKLG